MEVPHIAKFEGLLRFLQCQDHRITLKEKLRNGSKDQIVQLGMKSEQ